MKSLLRFLSLALVLAAVLSALAIWRGQAQPQSVPPTKSPQSTAEDTRKNLLLAQDEEFTELVASVLPSVVSIDAFPADAVDPGLQALRLLMGASPEAIPTQLGAGAIVSKDGHIVTNHHVISGSAAVRVFLSDGRILPAKLIGTDPASDIAILKIQAPDLKPLQFANSDEVKIGQKVFAVGNPLGLQETVTQGIISAKGRRALSEAANEYFQTDAAINQGNSGGPLVDMHGRLIGITNMVSARGEGIAFAIPSNTVKRVFESIRDFGRFIRPWFGALVRPITPGIASQLRLPGIQGALIAGTFEGSPAARAGLRPGDVVIEYNGRRILDHIDFRNRVVETPIGETVEITIIREGKESKIRARITKEPGA